MTHPTSLFRPRRGHAALPAAFALALAARPAHAQDAAALATRRELVEQATAARVANDHARALELAERASRISMSPSLRLFVAQEQSTLGRVADALGNAEQCAREAAGDTAIRNREAIEQTCRTLAETLRARVAHVTVQIASPPRGLAVTLNGRPLGDALWNAPCVVDAGPLVLEASAPGFRDVHRELTVAAGGSADVPLVLDALPTPDASGRPPMPPPSPPPSHPSYVAPVVLLGAGAAGMIAFGVFGGLRGGALARCPGDVCPDAGARDSVYALTTGANVSVAIGGAALAAGAVWLVLDLAAGGRAHPREVGARPPRVYGAPLAEGGAVAGIVGTL